MKRKHRKRFNKKAVFTAMVIFLLGVLCGKIVFAEEVKEEVKITESTMQENKVLLDGFLAYKEPVEERININRNRNSEDDENLWNLVLVNVKKNMEAGYEPELAEVENNYYVDKRIVSHLQQMLSDGRKVGMDFWICSAYRSMEKQTQLFENKVQRVMAEKRLSYEDAYEEAGKEVAYPGTSEHQLGLAVDIVAKDYQILDEKQANTDEAKWLKENCWKYGFILRYPLDKTEKTGIIFEPWHYRYVGIKAAKDIMEQGICLEEYLELEW